jgi:aspartate-semialdehyde dehydrogenase
MASHVLFRSAGAQLMTQAAGARALSSKPNVVIAGVTGAVGQEFLRVMDERKFPFNNLKLLASAKSAGKTVNFKGHSIKIEEMTEVVPTQQTVPRAF